MVIPSIHDFEEWFGCTAENPREGRFRFRVSDATVTLVFSFDIFEESIQAIISIADEPKITVVHENASKLWFQELGRSRLLLGECRDKEERTELKIEIQQRIQVEWSTLVEGGS